MVFSCRQAGIEAEGFHGFPAWTNLAGDCHAALQDAGREIEIVGGSEAPRAGVLVELEGMVFAVVVQIRGKNIENHPPRDFPNIFQRGMELDRETEEIAVVKRIGGLVQEPGGRVEMHTPQRLALHEIEAPHEQVHPRRARRFFDQSRFRHAHAGAAGHLRNRLFAASSRAIGREIDLENTGQAAIA